MGKVKWKGKLSFLLMIGVVGCSSAKQTTDTTKAAPAPEPVAAVSEPAPVEAAPAVAVDTANTIPEANLLLTKDGIEFAGVSCSAAYTSDVSGVAKNEQGKITAKTITSTCTSNGDAYTWAYTDMRYNSLGQMTGYKLKLSSSATGKEYKLACSNILRDNLWEVVMYKVRYDGKLYQFKRK